MTTIDSKADTAKLDAALEHLTGDHSVLRMSETEAELRSGYQPDSERMIMNMGPQHPSTHGVLRLVLELTGSKAEIVYNQKTDPGVSRIWADLTLARELLGYQARTSLAEGLRPDRWDLAGAAICLAGAALILFGPRTA